MTTWLIRWTAKDGEPGTRTIPRADTGVDVFDACRLAARLYGDVYFTALDHHGRPVRTDSAGHALWTKVTTDGHEIDVLLS